MGKEMRVFGPPGTGKTTYLAAQVENAIDRYGQDSVLIASFTRTAAHEIATRVKDLGLSRDQVGTLHALCYRALGSPTIAETKADEFNSWQQVYKLSAGGVDMDEPEQQFVTEADKLLADYQVMRARITPRSQWPLDVASFGSVWEKWKTISNYIDFTDMIEIALADGLPPPSINGEQPMIGFFDEAQDFTPLELALVRQWAESLEYVVVAGDDDQSIYQFKGSNPDAFLNPPLPDSQKRTLGQSYRMPGAIHSYSQFYISQVQRREPKFFHPRKAEGSVEHRPALTYIAPEAIVNEAAAYIDDNPISTVMLLASCSYQVQSYVNELRRQALPFHNPYRRRRGDWNPLRATRGTTSAQRILALLRPDEKVWGPVDCRPWTVDDVRSFMGLLPKTGVVRRGAFKEVDDAPGEQLADADMCARVFEDGVVDALLLHPLNFLQEHVAAAKSKAIVYPLAIARKNPRMLLRQPRIIVGTIHSVKGGEADCVYLAPDLSRAGMSDYLDRGADSTTRMFYVGMTRAKERLVLTGPATPASVKWPQY